VNGPEADWIVGEPALEFGYHARLIGTVAQLVEQGPFKALVLGSSPSRPTIKSSIYANLSVRRTETVHKLSWSTFSRRGAQRRLNPTVKAILFAGDRAT
jgi:hypothetical protein